MSSSALCAVSITQQNSKQAAFFVLRSTSYHTRKGDTWSCCVVVPLSFSLSQETRLKMTAAPAGGSSCTQSAFRNTRKRELLVVGDLSFDIPRLRCSCICTVYFYAVLSECQGFYFLIMILFFQAEQTQTTTAEAHG